MPNDPIAERCDSEFMFGRAGRELKPTGGRGTLRSAGAGENPRGDRDPGARYCGAELIGGRGMLRAISGLPPRCISLLLTDGRCTRLYGAAGRCMLGLPGRGAPRKAGEGTAPRALSGPCGIMLEGVSGPRVGEATLLARAGEP